MVLYNANSVSFFGSYILRLQIGTPAKNEGATMRATACVVPRTAASEPPPAEAAAPRGSPAFAVDPTNLIYLTPPRAGAL